MSNFQNRLKELYPEVVILDRKVSTKELVKWFSENDIIDFDISARIKKDGNNVTVLRFASVESRVLAVLKWC